eukprot:89073-Prymnesium_polylepis.1
MILELNKGRVRNFCFRKIPGKKGVCKRKAILSGVTVWVFLSVAAAAAGRRRRRLAGCVSLLLVRKPPRFDGFG